MAPEQFDRTELGETPADEPEAVLDRTIDTSLEELRDGAESNANLTFRITDVGSDAAHTEFVSHQLERDYLRSLVRRGTSKVEVVLRVTTADDYRIKIHPVAFTTKRADHSQKKAIRRTMIDMVEETAAEKPFDELLDTVLGGQLSSGIYSEAKTIYPLRRVEIQQSELIAHPEEVHEQEATSVEVDADE